jgi:hypothetical protein
MPLVPPLWDNDGLGYPHHGKEQSEIHELRASEVVELSGVAAGDDGRRRLELRGETLLELEANNERR